MELEITFTHTFLPIEGCQKLVIMCADKRFLLLPLAKIDFKCYSQCFIYLLGYPITSRKIVMLAIYLDVPICNVRIIVAVKRTFSSELAFNKIQFA